MPVAAITGLGKTVLLIVAITFIAWALITAIFVSKRSPGFPKRLDAYIVVSALLFIAQMGAVVWVTGTQETEEETHAAETGGGAATEGGTTTEAPTGDTAAGKQVFESAGCVACHTLADAGSTGTVGPNLDDANIDVDAAAQQIKNGGGGMPAFGDRLSDQEIADVAAFVTQ